MTDSENTGGVEAPDTSATDAAIDKAVQALVADRDAKAAEEPEDAPEADEAPEAAPEPEAGGERSAEAQKALDNLKLRTHVPESVLEGMDDTDLVRWWGDLAPHSLSNDQVYRESKELRKQLEELTSKLGETADANAGAEPQRPTVTADEKAAISALADEIGLDSDGASKLEGLFASYGQRVKDDVERALRPIRESSAAAEAAFEETVRRDLGERFPGVMENDTWSAVRQSMDRLSKGGFHSDKQGLDRVRALAETAAQLEAPAAPVSASAPKDERLESRVRNGSPTRPRSKAQKVFTNPDDRLSAAIGMVMGGEKVTVKDLQKKLG